MRLQSVEKGSQGFEISEEVAQAVNEAANHINRILDNPAHINALDVLRWPGVLSVPEQDYGPAKDAAVSLFEQTVTELASVREREGERLRLLFEDRLKTMSDLVAAYENVCRNCSRPGEGASGAVRESEGGAGSRSGYPGDGDAGPEK